MSVSSVSSTKPSSSTSSAPLYNFSAFVPSKITLFRDGGTIKLEGNINRSMPAKVRYDGHMSSPTRGRFFVAVNGPGGKAQPERALTKAELKTLQTALKSFIKTNPDAGATYQLLLKNMEKALSSQGTSLPTTAKLKSVYEAALANNVKWSEKMPVELTENNVRKTYTISKPPPGRVGASIVTGRVLKAPADKVVFSRYMGGRHFFLGPISFTTPAR